MVYRIGEMFMPSFRFRFALFILALTIISGLAHSAAAQDLDRIVQPMAVVDATTLQADDTRITLWGIKVLPGTSAALQLRATDLVKRLTGDSSVNCKPVEKSAGKVIARCNGNNGTDLALELLNGGYAVVDIPAVNGTAFAEAYAQGQDSARTNAKGIWREVAAWEREDALPPSLQPYVPILPLLTPVALFAGPFLGILITVLLMSYWLYRIRRLQQEDHQRTEMREAELALRERRILISALAGELSENKSKLLAFLKIYREMLKDLQNPNETPKYQRVGDIVQKHPAMGKRVFDASIGKLSLLDIALSGHLSRLYNALPEEREYINLDPDLPIEKAVETVQKVIAEAESLLTTLDQTAHAMDQAARDADAVPAAAN